MENFIFRQKKKMDEESHKQKIKELQDKYIPFLKQLIIKLNDANTGRSRQAQLEKMKSLLSLLRDRPRTLTNDVLIKTENVLETLYRKLGSGNTQDNMRAIEDKPRDDPQNSKTLALRPNMDVQLRNHGAMNLDVVKQKLLHVNEAPKSMDLANPGKQGIDESVLKQKANAIIGDKGRPIDSRVEQHAVTSEIRLSVNRISTVISSRTDRTIINALPEPIPPPQGCPIPLGNFQSSQSVDLYCRRTQDRTIYQRRFSGSQAHSSNNTLIHTTSRPAIPAPPIRPEITSNDSDINILNSPPLSSDDIQSLMMETNSNEKAQHENSSKISHTGETRLAHKYNPHPRNERTSSHLPIDATGQITVSLDDPRLKKPISQNNDPRLDPRLKRMEHSQNVVSKYNSRGTIEASNHMTKAVVNRKSIEGPIRMAIEGPNRKGIEGPNWIASEVQSHKAIEGPNRKAIEGPPIRKAIEGPQIRKTIEVPPIRKVTDDPPNQKLNEASSRKAVERRKSIECRKPVEIKSAQYEVVNPAPPKKSFNTMERRSELDDDYMDAANSSGISKFQNLKSIESVPREKRAGDPSVPVMKSQFDKMYRKNDFSQDYNKHVKNINQGIKDFKIPKKSLPKPEKGGESKNKLADKVKDDEIGKFKENKQDKSVEKKVKVKSIDKQRLSLDKSATKHQKAKSSEESNKKTASETYSDSEITAHDEVIYKTAKKRIKIIDTDSESENSDLDSVALLSRKSTTLKNNKKKQDRPTQATVTEKPKAKRKTADKRVSVLSGVRSDEDISNSASQSKDSTPEPVSSTGQLDSEPPGKCYTNDTHHPSNADVEGTKDSITKEWLESVLPNMMNPKFLTKDKLLDMMKNVMDEKKFERVKYIMESDDVEAEDKEGSLKDEDKCDIVSEVAAASCSRTINQKKQKKAPKKKNTELDKLNEDIRTMFISEGVLTATGRRMCTELRKKSVQCTDSTPPESPKSEKYQEEVDPTSPLPGPSKRGRKRKVTDVAHETSLEKESGATNDVSKQLNINRMLKVELQKLKDSEIPQKISEKKAVKKSKEADDESVSNSPTPKKKVRRRNNIWFRNPPKKKKNQRSSSIGTDNEQSQFALAEPPIKRRPGPKSKTQIIPEQNMAASAPLDVGAIKKEQIKQSYSMKNIDPTSTSINNKTCKVCAYSGKQIVTHYVKEHHEVFCSRLPRNISEFLKSHEKGMLFAESYNMKLQYTGSKVFGHCIFCREEMYEQPNRWLTHFAKHTGEFEYVCSCGIKAWSAKLIRIHVKKCEERGTYEFKAHNLCDELYIKAYMCGDCNFLQLQPENVQNHIKKEHATKPRIHQVILLNYGDETVKEHQQTFLEMYKHNITSLDLNQDEGVFKSTDEKTNESVASKSILEDISKAISNECTSDIADKLHDRFGEKSAIKLKEDLVVKTEAPISEAFLEFGTKESSNILAADPENPIEYDDDEWEDIESDSDESVMSQSSRPGQNKKFARLTQKIGPRGSAKRKSDSNELSSPKRSRVELTPAGLNQNKPKSSVICKSETCEVYKVENFQYQIGNGEAQYYCLMTKCLFISSVVELFIDHLMKVHDDDTWSGYCELCKEDKFPASRSMITEFHHLVSDHPWKKLVEDPPAAPVSPPVDPEMDTKEDAKPAIRLRRLSGDKLSAQMEDSFKMPTTPTNTRSVTIRRISKSPDLSSSPSTASTTSVSPTSSLHTALSLVQTTPPRSIIITKTSSLESPNVTTTFTSQANTTPTSLTISSVSPIQSLKTFTFTLPSTKPTSTYGGNIVPVANSIQLPAKIAIRRSTISTDVLPGIIPRMDHGNELMPWIKKPGTKIQYAVKKMLEKEVICAAFKCMGTECWYFTMNEMEMNAHLKNHDQIIEDQAEKTTISDTSSWLECSYCDYMADSRNDLMTHLKMNHLHCEYLCPKCFYRAINANYVARHLQEYHKSNINVWYLSSEFKNTIAENAVSCVKDNVKLLTCKTCDIKFLNSLHFSEHILSHANLTFECGFCSAMIPIDMMKKHMFCHSVADFECIYCEFATSNKNTLSKHMCDRHSNRKLIFYNREEPQEHLEKFKLSNFEDFCQFRVTVEKIIKESLSQSNHKVQRGTSILKSNLFTTSTISPPVVAPNQGPMPLVISNVVSLHGQPQASSLMIKDVCTLAKDAAISSPSNSTVFNQSPTGTKKVQATPPTQSNAIILEGVSVSKEEFEKQSFGFSTALTKAIVDWVGKTGISQKELLKCSESECSFQGKFKGDFMEHIDRSHSNALLKCPQCVNVFWHSSASLWNHLETHGQKRYFCIMCDFTAKTEPQMVAHCTDTVHKWLAYSVVPIANVTVNGIYVVCPRNTSSLKIEQFKADFVRNIQQLSPQSRATAETSKDMSNTDSYGPDEIDKLPSKPVVKNVYCKLCGYKTMIVKNLIRHFDAHRQAVYVPNLDPVNPVPCLSSNEKNFDKMTNLACSSNMDSRSKTLSEPVYIMQQKRFVCGVSYCTYITIDDIMLKYHLSTLHANEKSYKCPHCHTELYKGEFSVDTIIMHYRLHGEKLFMCDKCQYMSDTTQNVEKHIKNAHGGAGNIYILRDESRNEASAAAEPPPAARTTTAQDDVQQKKWICNECNHTTYLKTDMATHALEMHNTKYQYQCGYCTFYHPTRSYIIEHIKQRHGDKVIIREAYAAIKPGAKMTKTVEDSMHFWRRDSTGAKSIRGIPCESSEILPRTNEEDEEDYLSEDDYPDHMTNVPVAVDITVSKKQNVDDFALPVKHHRIERIIQCNLCEKTTRSALTMQVVHFPECHPGVPVSTKIIEQISTLESNALPIVEEETKIPNGYKLICFHCQTSCDEGLNQFKKHYVDQHTEKSSIDIPPCLFSFVKLMYCGLCQQVRSTYDDIGKHLMSVHKTESVIVKSSTENVICGACDYDAGDEQNLLRHAKLRHTNKKFKPLIPQATLDDMLNIHAYPMKRCTACKELVCDIDGRQSEEHLRTKHSASVMATFVNIRNPSYICGRCHVMSDSDTNAFTHILTHTKSFKCSVCANFFAKYEEALEHMKALHLGDGNVIQFAWPLDAIFESLMVFPNGLVLSLEELQMTKYRFDQSKFKMLRNVVVRKQMITSNDLLL